ncbi:hypothetical protein HON22_02045 [Candidatus Peregrinibacteria bacterium]|nr:hypothetical protein [Candidatus Peregrinibacteria bacterium]
MAVFLFHSNSAFAEEDLNSEKNISIEQIEESTLLEEIPHIQAADSDFESIAAPMSFSSSPDAPEPISNPPKTNPFQFGHDIANNLHVDFFSGSANFSIPFEIPKGRKNSTPNISLNYSSNNHSFDTQIAYGWSLPVSAISRISKKGTDKLYSEDHFSMSIFGSGAELIAVNNAKTQYAAQTESNFTKYEYLNNSWVATDKDATKYFFGTSANSQQSDPNNGTKIYRWMLAKLEDIHGNTMEFSYFKDSGQVYIEHIRYSGFGNDTGIYEIKFIRSLRSIPHESYQSGFKVETKYHISTIELWLHSKDQVQFVKKLSLQYIKNGAVELLQSVQIQSENLSLPATSFNYYTGKENTPDQKIHLLKKITLPFGGTKTLLYKPSTTYRPNGLHANTNLPFVIHTLHKLTSFDPIANESFTQTYSYEGGHYFYDPSNPFIKEYAGFHSVSITDPYENLTKKFFHQSEYAPDNSQSALGGEFEDHISKKGKLYREEIYEGENSLLEVSIHTWDKRKEYDTNEEEERWFPFLSKSVKRIYETTDHPISSAQSFTYDDYGNTTELKDYGEVEVLDNSGEFKDIKNDLINSENTYIYLENPYIVSHTSMETVKDIYGDIISQTQWFYDNLGFGSLLKGNITEIKKRSDVDGNFISTKYTYNKYGLVESMTNPRGFKTRYSYDTYNLYPFEIINSYNHKETHEYDYRFGSLLQTTDPNGNIQKWEQDPFGRLTKYLVSDLDNINQLSLSLENSYYFSESVPYTKSIEYGNNYAKESRSYVNGFGKTLQVRTEAEAENIVVSNSRYDFYENVRYSSYPFFHNSFSYVNIEENEKPGIYSKYDAMNRLVELRSPLGIKSITYFPEKQVHNDENNNSKDLYYDIRGNLTQVIEYLGENTYSTIYSYDLLGNLVKTKDANGNIAYKKYNLLSQNIYNELLHRANEQNIKFWRYEYDANGNIKKSTDPSGNIIDYRYDALDRLTSEKNGREVLTSFAYDASLYGIGKLSSISTKNYSKNLVYDIHGNLVEENIGIDGESYKTEFLYHNNNRLLSTIYPQGGIVVYGYNNAGYLENLRFDNDLLISDINYAPTGAIAKIIYGNGSISENIFDEQQNYRLIQKTTTSGEKELQNLHYTYDAVGNILSVKELNNNSLLSREASYIYDDLYRLTDAHIVSVKNNEDTLRKYEYDPVGNMTFRTDAGAYAYNASHPHAVSSVGDISYTYDASGNMRTRGDASMEWDIKNRLQKYSSNGKDISYSYNEARERVTKYDASSLEKTVYVNNYFHKEAKEEKRFIYAGDLKVATISKRKDSYTACSIPSSGDFVVSNSCSIGRDTKIPANIIVKSPAVLTIESPYILEVDLKNFSLLVKDGAGVLIKQGAALRQTSSNVFDIALEGKNYTAYHHLDHLTGASVDTNEDAKVLEEIDYFPFGDVRIENTLGTYENDFTFTGQEFDDESDLYYYGSRYYDSHIGRFTSVDPWEGDISDPQSWNKFSYVKNNPLIYVDPSGENPFAIPLLAVAEEALAVVTGAIAGIIIGDKIADTNITTTPAENPSSNAPTTVPGITNNNPSNTSLPGSSYEGLSSTELPSGGVDTLRSTSIPALEPAKTGCGVNMSCASEENRIPTPDNSDDFIKLKGGQGWKAKDGKIWKKSHTSHKGEKWKTFDKSTKGGTRNSNKKSGKRKSISNDGKVVGK